MNTVLKLLVPIGFTLMAGCVIAPVGPRHPYPGLYYGARVGLIAPVPVIVVRP